MSTVLIIVLLLVAVGIGYYFYQKSSSTSTSSSTPSETPALGGITGIWEVNSIDNDGKTSDNNYTLKFTDDGVITPSINNFPLSNVRWTNTTWSGVNSSGNRLSDLPLKFDAVKKQILLYTSPTAAKPFLALLPTPAPTPSPTPTPTPSSSSTPSPTPSPTASSTLTPSPTPTPTPSPTPFVPTAPPVKTDNIKGQYVQLLGQKKAVLNISRVDIFTNEYDPPLQYPIQNVSGSSVDKNSTIYGGVNLFFATQGTEIPSIKIDLGQNTNIYKIDVYNRIDGYVQRICGMALSILDSKYNTVYSSDAVMCPQLKTNADGSLVTDPITKKPTYDVDAKGNPKMDTGFIDSANDVTLYPNIGVITYFPNINSHIIQSGAPNLFRGIWHGPLDNNSKRTLLIMRSDTDAKGNLTMTQVSKGAVLSGMYIPLGLSGYALLQGMTKAPTEPNIAFQYSPTTTNTIRFQDTDYYLNSSFGWYLNANAGNNANIQNVQLKPDGTITDINNQNIGTYSIVTNTVVGDFQTTSSLVQKNNLFKNPFIGAWMSVDLPKPIVIVFNPDMTCTDGKGVYPYTYKPTDKIKVKVTFVNSEKTTIELIVGELNMNPFNRNVDLNFSVNGTMLKDTTLTTTRWLLNPFYGTWNSSKFKRPISFSGDCTVSGYSPDQYWVNGPNSQFTSLVGLGYITGHIQGIPGKSSDNLDMAYNIDTDTIYVYNANSYSTVLDTLTR